MLVGAPAEGLAGKRWCCRWGISWANTRLAYACRLCRHFAVKGQDMNDFWRSGARLVIKLSVGRWPKWYCLRGNNSAPCSPCKVVILDHIKGCHRGGDRGYPFQFHHGIIIGVSYDIRAARRYRRGKLNILENQKTCCHRGGINWIAGGTLVGKVRAMK